MIHVTHDRDHRRTWEQFIFDVLSRFVQKCVWVIQFRRKGFMTEFLNQNHRGVLVKHLVNRHHLTHTHQNFNYFRGFNRHFVRQIRYRNGFWHVHFLNDWLSRRSKTTLIGVLLVAVFALAFRTPTTVIACHATGF